MNILLAPKAAVNIVLLLGTDRDTAACTSLSCQQNLLYMFAGAPPPRIHIELAPKADLNTGVTVLLFNLLDTDTDSSTHTSPSGQLTPAANYC
jgi:hypothetical protein